MRKTFLLVLIAVALCSMLPSCDSRKNDTAATNKLRDRISEYASTLDAEIGIAVIFNGSDTLTYGNEICYPMMSVYKFPQALAVADYLHKKRIPMSTTITVDSTMLRPDTYSPMAMKYGSKTQDIGIDTLLYYSLVLSDNNACDILFNLIGGTKSVSAYLNSINANGISVTNTESEMHADNSLCYANSATPMAMARLFEKFHTQLSSSTPEMQAVATTMKQCRTGLDRLPAPLGGTGAEISHKTGTGFVNADNRLSGFNDAGTITLPNGKHYSMAVFIKDGIYSPENASRIIADISRIILDHAQQLP